MFKNNKKIVVFIIIIGLIFVSSQMVSAQGDNETNLEMDDNSIDAIEIQNEDDYQLNEISDDNELSIDNANSNGNDLSVDNDNLDNERLSSSDNITIFLVSDNPGTNILDVASRELYDEYDLKNVNFVVRSGFQVKEMEETEFARLLYNCDAFIGEWVSTDVDAVLTSVLSKDPTLSNKKLFFILEPPVGNLNSESSSIELIRRSTLNYTRIFTSLSNEELISYFKSTKRGTDYGDVEQAIRDYGSNFNEMFNKMVLYKDIHDKDNLKNQI